MSDALGTARVDLVVNTDSFIASVDRAKSKLTGLGDEAQAAFNKSDEKSKRAAVSLARYVELMGKGALETRLLQSAFRGIDTTVLAELEKRAVGVQHGIDSAKRAAQEFEATTAFQTQAAAARELVRASEYVRFWEDALQDADRAQTKLASQRSFINSLQQQAIAINKTKSELLEMKAAEMGVTAEAAPFIAQLRAQERALMATSRELNKYGMSAKEMQFALRGVPAQLTDITVSLAGGQNPLMVLLQQGGQLRDMFGGLRPAFSALASSVAGLINPFTLAAGAVAALVAVQVSVESEANKLNQALILSGNAGGQTAESMRDLAESISEVGTGSTGQALDALRMIVEGGKVAIGMQGEVAAAAVAMSNATGQELSEVIAKYNDIGRDPVAALQSLGAAHGFVTQEIYKQVVQLDEQGDRAGAAAVLMAAYAADQKRDAAEIKEKLGLVTGAWDAIKEGTRKALSEAKTYFVNADRDAKTFFENAKKYAAGFTNLMGGGGPMGAYGYVAGLGQAPGAGTGANAPGPLPGVGKGLTPEQSRLRAEYDILRRGNQTRQERQKIEEGLLETARKQGAITAEEYKTELARSRAAFAAASPKGPKPKKPPSTRSVDNADLRADLDAIRQTLQIEQDAIANSRRVTEAEFNAKQISVEEYYRRTRQAMEGDAQLQERAIVQQLEVLRGRKASGADAINITKQIAAAEAELTRARAKATTDLDVLAKQEQDVYRQRELAYKEFQSGLAEVTLGIERDTKAQILRVTVGQKAYETEMALAEVYERTRLALKALNEERERSNMSPADFERRKRDIERSQEDQLEAVRRGRAAVAIEQGEWLNGLTTGIQDWIDAQSDVAGSIHSITTKALDSTADALANFVATGKLEWRDLLSSILKDILQFMAKQVVMQFAQQFLTGFLGNGAGASTSQVGSGQDFGNYAAKGAYFAGGEANFFAKGGAFTNSIVNRPTGFKFGKGGQFGVMGEAGPEAIMPLKRGPDGSLGIQSHGKSGGGNTVTVNVTTVVNSDGTASSKTDMQGDEARLYAKFGEEMRNIAEQHLQRSLMPNGTLYNAGITSGA